MTAALSWLCTLTLAFCAHLALEYDLPWEMLSFCCGKECVSAVMFNDWLKIANPLGVRPQSCRLFLPVDPKSKVKNNTSTVESE